MDFVKWGLNPWGESILTHVSWTLFWAALAGQIAVQGARALRYNSYKIPLMRNLVKRAILGGGGGTWTS